jgi:hypothetical protein
MGSPDARAYSRNKRGIAGSLIWINFDRHSLLNLIQKCAGTFVADRDEIRPAYSDVTDGGSVFSSSVVRSAGPSIGSTIDALDNSLVSAGQNKQLATPWYSDQVLPFDITLSGANEYGAMCAARSQLTPGPFVLSQPKNLARGRAKPALPLHSFCTVDIPCICPATLDAFLRSIGARTDQADQVNRDSTRYSPGSVLMTASLLPGPLVLTRHGLTPRGDLWVRVVQCDQTTVWTTLRIVSREEVGQSLQGRVRFLWRMRSQHVNTIDCSTGSFSDRWRRLGLFAVAQLTRIPDEHLQTPLDPMCGIAVGRSTPNSNAFSLPGRVSATSTFLDRRCCCRA